MIVLGDLIDRGPNSFDVVQFVKNSKNIASLKGNHEKMMIDLLTTAGLESPDYHLDELVSRWTIYGYFLHQCLH